MKPLKRRFEWMRVISRIGWNKPSCYYNTTKQVSLQFCINWFCFWGVVVDDHQVVPPFARPAFDRLKQKQLKATKPFVEQHLIPGNRPPTIATSTTAPVSSSKAPQTATHTPPISSDSRAPPPRPSLTTANSTSASSSTAVKDKASNQNESSEFNPSEMTVVPEFGHDFSFL